MFDLTTHRIGEVCSTITCVQMLDKAHQQKSQNLLQIIFLSYAVTILGSESCQSILNFVSEPTQCQSCFFGVCDSKLSTEAGKQLQSFYQTTAPYITCHYGPEKAQSYKVKV